jgi:hypothetical protein
MRYLYTSIILLLALAAQAQSDSVRTEYQTEDASISKSEVKRFIRYITRTNVEEKTLIKVGIWPGMGRGADDQFDVLKHRLGVNAEVAIERKINPSFSFLAGLNGYWRYTDYRLPTYELPSGLDPSLVRTVVQLNILDVEWKAGFRYYHSMASRMRRGVSANNFSGNYIGFTTSQALKQFRKEQLFNWVDGGIVDRKRNTNLLGNSMYRVALQYGVQRRVGRLGYIDINAGPELFYRGNAKYQLSLQFNAIIGLGW